MIQRNIVCLFILLLCPPAFSQSIKSYTQSNIQTIRSINPADSTYDDLQVIADAIGDSKIVLLGEQDHGDAPSFLAKTRLIKFLHETKGFDVLLFESDFYSLTSGWDAFKRREITINTFFDGNIFDIWTKCTSCIPLFQYITQTQTTTAPLIIGGFDCQLHGSYRKGHYKKEMLQFLTGLPSEEAGNYAERLGPLLDTAEVKYPLLKNISSDTLIMYGKVLDSLIQRLDGLADSNYYKALIQNLRSYVYMDIYTAEKSNETMTVRDKQMAANIEWLLRNTFLNKKVIIWAANYHIAKDLNEPYFPNYSGTFKTMGSFLSEKFGDKLYILGFDSYEGRTGRVTMNTTYNVAKPLKNSIEKWIYSKNREYAFLDFKKFRQEYQGDKPRFLMKGKSHFYNETTWTTIFDGIFYIRQMYPCEKIP